MTHTRRQLTWTLVAVTGAAGLLGASAVPAQDDDDRPENLFISPAGQPFRAHDFAPYPVAAWFNQADKNSDGRLDHAEFLADAEAFFKQLDLNGDGVLDNYEISLYEHRVAPEILGYRVNVSALAPWRGASRLWLAQAPVGSALTPAPEIQQPERAPTGLDESQQGAAPYGFFQAPEPVTAADVDFRGLVFKANFLKLADHHFSLLDHDNAGFLTLAKLPKTAVQTVLERMSRRRR
jgi:hypothetical protein